ncbi:mechanosensitive ion channel domain-containing protein, partial [Clostridium perfringens]|uniref:mechanosensitive ion channel domain-containing protein n=1 Tax=Clostridium perfringens TaxID=1502 RepID=UPI003754AAE2
MTAFAFLGGAAMIALGFGTQKIAADLFAGIILLFQRRLRVGDIIVIDGATGVIEEITMQSTVLCCEQSSHLIIPNSKMLSGAIL